jgi:hypothetical protein
MVALIFGPDAIIRGWMIQIEIRPKSQFDQLSGLAVKIRRETW